MKKILLSSLRSTKPSRPRLPGEPRPFKERRTRPQFPPQYEIRAHGPDTIEQTRKERRLKTLLEKHSLAANKTLFQDLLTWELTQ